MRESVKHRLIGAAVLAAVAVLFLPSFFKDRQQYQVDTSSQIPGRPSITAVDFNEPERPEGIESAPAPETMFIPDESESIEAVVNSASSTAPGVASVQSLTGVSSVSSQASSSKQRADTEVPILPLNAQGLPEGWVIQVASLGAQNAANKLRDQLQSEGYRAYVRTVPVGTGTIHRVFIGPKQNKAEAIAIKAQLDKQLKVNSLVLPFKP